MMTVDKIFYSEVLYPLQDQVIKIIREVKSNFYLTGGTAASRGYLNHRYSDDLDFFVNDNENFKLWVDRIIQTLSKQQSWQIEILSRHDRYIRVNLSSVEAILKLEFINDVPSRVGDVSDHKKLGRLDSADNILANKISALLSREEPKDIADVWGFYTKMNLSIKDAIAGAKSKAAGIFPADLARVLLSTCIEDWEVIRWIQPPEPHKYLEDLKYLGESLILLD